MAYPGIVLQVHGGSWDVGVLQYLRGNIIALRDKRATPIAAWLETTVDPGMLGYFNT